MLTAKGIVKDYPGRKGSSIRGVDGASLHVDQGTLFTLLGPSGCGKTTTLRCIAGLETPDAGEIVLAGRTLFSRARGLDIPTSDRGIAMVFQSYALWPHMTARDNVSFPLRAMPRRRRPSRRVIDERVDRALAAVRLEGLDGRPATGFSGGQQQRLALARALVLEPPLLLLDEPLSNLDATLREEMRFELKRLQSELGITTVYVTHDQVEALAISDVVAVMRDGVIDQIAPPRTIYERPGTRFVAEFLGSANLIEGRVERETGDGYVVRTAFGPVHAAAAERLVRDAEVVLVLRPEQISISAPSASGNGQNRMHGVVRGRAFLGAAVDHIVALGPLELRVRSDPAIDVEEGTDVDVTFSPASTALLPR